MDLDTLINKLTPQEREELAKKLTPSPTPECRVEFELYENGKLESLKQYLGENLHGVCLGWYENGQLCYETTYQNGKEHGIEKWWRENGELGYVFYHLYGKEVTQEEYEATLTK